MLKGGPLIFRLLFRGPKLKQPGVDCAGVVEAVGPAVTQIKVGESVFGNCRGAFAEYAAAPESRLAPKPASVSFEDAAACPVAALTALQGLRKHGKIQPGQNILINGASGGVGTFAVQLGKIFGAHVTAVCSVRNADIVRSLGADHVIDYATEDFTQGTERYDLILDMAGSHPFSVCQRVLTPRGIHVGGGILAGQKPLLAMFAGLIAALVRSRFSTQKFVVFMAKGNREDLAFLGELVANGKLKPVIDKRYSLAEVPDAIRYQGTWRAREKLVIGLEAQPSITSSSG